MAKKEKTEQEVPEAEPEVEVNEKESTSAEEVAGSIENTAQEAFDTVYQYARNVPAEAVAYVVLALGLVILPFHHLWGGALVGIIFGVYYCEETIQGIRSLRDYIEQAGRVKSIVLGGTFLALLIVVPTLFLGAAAATGILSLLQTQKKPKAPTKKKKDASK